MFLARYIGCEFDRVRSDMSGFSGFTIRHAGIDDVAAIVALSDQKRRDYEKAQPQFWKRAAYANECQAEWFVHLLNTDDHMLLLAEDAGVVGFIIGRTMSAPEVYDPGGLTLMIDDFCMSEPNLWLGVGAALLDQLKQEAQEKGAMQVVVACGNHDGAKINFLESMGLSVATRWYVGGI
jgi:hypothetical protein